MAKHNQPKDAGCCSIPIMETKVFESVVTKGKFDARTMCPGCGRSGPLSIAHKTQEEAIDGAIRAWNRGISS